MHIDQATAFLYALKPRGIRFGLENTRLVLERLGRPQDRFQAVHLAGSNGKGSTAAFLDAMVRQAGHRVGLYTSPHLRHFGERFRVDGSPVDDADIEAVMDIFLRDGLQIDPREVRAWVESEDMISRMQAPNWYRERGGASRFCRLTFFECTTVLAMMLFARKGVELAVMECGMGGRLDATNVLEPLCSVIMPIHLEHTTWLGESLTAIAGEKAGIIKKGVPVVSAPQAEEALAVIAGQAAAQGAPLHLPGREFHAEGGWRRARFRTPGRNLGPVRLGLCGRHQVDNAGVAVGCLPVLGNAGFTVSDRQAETGLARVRWPGRFERLGPDGRWILDGAHNPDGIGALVETTRDVLGGRKVQLVFGVLEDKKVEPMLRQLAPVAERLLLVRPEDARGRDPAGLRSLWPGPVEVVGTVPAALGRLLDASCGPVLVTGSLALIGEARAWLVEKGEIPWPCEERDRT